MSEKPATLRYSLGEIKAKRAGGEDETHADAMNVITAKYIQFSGAGYDSAVAEAMR